VDTLFVTHNFENRIRSIRSGFQTVQQQPLRLLLAPDGNTIARRPKRFNLFTRTELNVFEIRARRRQACRDLGKRDEIVFPAGAGFISATLSEQADITNAEPAIIQSFFMTLP